MARSDPGSRSRLARWSRWVGGRVVLVVALVASVGVAGAQPAAAETRWLQVDAGKRHTCGIRESSAGAGMGTLWCWGRNNEGQLGLGDRTTRTVPTQVGRDADWIMVTAGDEHTCALKGAARARYCWGFNYYGRLGLGTDGSQDERYRRYLSPTAGGDSGWMTLSAGTQSTCGIRKIVIFPAQLQAPLCWGENYSRKLGVPTGGNKLAPTLVVGGGQWTEVSVGNGAFCGLRSDTQGDGRRYCWGSNSVAQLGLGWRSVVYKEPGLIFPTGDPPPPVTEPTAIPEEGSWSTVSMGEGHGCGISVNRRAYCWGRTEYGAVGLGQPGPNDGCCVLAPETRLPGTSWAQIHAAGDSTCGLTTNGTRLCWGRNDVGQLGVGDRQRRYTPTEPQGPEGPIWESITLGHTHGCGIRKNNGALLCWGSNAHGMLGNSQVPEGQVETLPVPVG